LSRFGLDFNDERWTGLVGGYRTPYDPRPALRSLEQRTGVEEAWQELCTELYHQGDVGEASYAAVPHLVRIYEEQGIPDWNTYALVATIEEARQVGKNPDLPSYLCDAYEEAWGELFKMMTDVATTHVHYRGGGPALTDLLSGQVQVFFNGVVPSIEYIRTGQLRALAVSTATRSDALPEVPTVSEFVPGYEVSTWYGVGAPKNTPGEIVDK